ncbi:fungal-specific transcription factor domain-containing protein [Nemania sp. FL0031]|nr:fungal-specific transcription factor domain-containing protein [Nemania sp. FL0031]
MASTDRNKATRGCWTCKDRRVRCDRGLPSCANCARVRQACQGYGVRLSWPKIGDTRRAIVGRVSRPLATNYKRTGIELVHASYFDVEMYHYLVELRATGVDDDVVVHPPNLILPLPLPLKLVDLNAEDLELLQHFKSIAFTTLATFTADLPGLRDTLVRMALTNQTITSRAVLHAILAFSSLQRDGLQLQATKHKTAAVSALGASVKNGIHTTTEATQHLAANMLLCSLEIHMGTSSCGHWLWYLMGARDIIKAANLDTQIFRSEVGDFVLWAFYHDVLARFTFLHWRRGELSQVLAQELGVEGGWQRDLCGFASKLKINVGPLPRLLRFFGDTVDTLCDSAKGAAVSSDALRNEIRALERNAKTVTAPPMPPPSPANEAARRLVVVTELYQTAILVYIGRICENRFGESRDLKSLIDKGFAQLEQAEVCERQFPMFILGCEANTDERRITILSLMRRTEEKTHVRPLDCLRRGLDSVWIQDDLHADQDVKLDYMNKLNAVISSSPTPPAFV